MLTLFFFCLFKVHLINYLVEFVSEVIDEEVDPDGNIIRKQYGITRIPDIMAIKEMQAYRDGLKVDRLVALASLVAFVKIQIANRGYRHRVDNKSILNKNKKGVSLNHFINKYHVLSSSQRAQ